MVCVLVAMLVSLGFGAESMAEAYNKTILIVTDSLDFENLEKIDKDSSIGLLSLKSGGKLQRVPGKPYDDNCNGQKGRNS